MSERDFSSYCAEELERMILREGPDTVAAFIAEPFMGTGGLIPPPDGYWELIQPILERYDMSLGTGLGKVQGRVFRIGHLGDFNDLMLVGTLGGVEMGLANAGISFTPGGVAAALDYLANAS